jgi:hypothetical protein
LCVNELLSRIAVFAAGPPVSVAVPARVDAFARLRPACLFLRRPQLAAREPFHLGVGMFLLDSLERRQQLLTFRCPEGGGQSSRNDGPVRVARRHNTIVA